ncbi:Ribonucleotide reductase, all-alpha domain containing protein [Tritrichomonas foetus]|uniref:ribonucleoside-diphosphate reductase n=1 Tax=Tritrichomonas foetus TaxID=1144522 RepID=A0A1J4JA55_9EUKA|nr:Ribonucleotide reductase, all-alpha domain containing protein [Tritrichomonas foetus]|eukprot:OHS95553.1 Ribonucleotide reductase, all-alpha domain containing protein [Tritrichomonas foetus]
MFTPNAMKVLEGRYLRQDHEGNLIEDADGMFHRVSSFIASAEKEPQVWQPQFESIMKEFKFIPAGRTLSNSGTQTPLVSNCVVLHPSDSLLEIFQTLEDAAVLHKYGSGVGFPFHLLRPAGFQCKRTLGVSSGPVSFLQIYSKSFHPISQHGREPANMGIMRIDHPDVLEFISAKLIEGKYSNFNFSIALTDEFMDAAINRPTEPWLCEWKGQKMKPRKISRDPAGRVTNISDVDITTGDLLDTIVHFAWSNGEPGVVFIDTVNKKNPLPGIGRIECCNPCGEQYLHDGDACNLGAINLEMFVSDKGNGNEIDFDELKRVTKLAIRFLDDVVDKTDFAVDRVKNMFTGNRRIGLGIMGLADLLFKMRIPYDSEEGRNMARYLMKTIQDSAIEASVELGEEKGSFPNFEKSVWAQTKKTMRNASLTNVAPTGSTSMLFDVSSGIEPYFALAYRRANTMNGTKMEPFVNKHLKEALEMAGCYNEEIMEKVLSSGSLQKVPEVPEEIRKVFVTSLDIAAEDHVKMQAAVQEYCCNAISKTINFTKDALPNDIKNAFIEGWRSGIKGMTVYRNGSRESQVLVTNTESNEPVQTFMTTCKDGKCDI